MISLKRTFVLGLFATRTVFCYAQHDSIEDTVKLNEVAISANKLELYVPVRPSFSIDAKTLERNSYQSLSVLLSEETSIYIRNYGQGGSAVISMRGLEPRHTQLSWNGFNINSASLGMSDASIIPLQSFNEFSFINGSNSTMAGNSSMGGVLLLQKNRPTFRKRSELSIYGMAGSFETYNTGIQALFATNHIESNTRIFINKSSNNFTFINTALKDNPEQKQINSELDDYGIVQDFAIKINNEHSLDVGLWYQVTDRNIPPIMTVPSGNASQKDSILRSYLKYHYLKNKTLLSVGGAWFNEHQQYKDPEHLIDSRYDIDNYYANADVTHQFNSKYKLTGGVSYNVASANFNEYDGQQHRKIFSIYTGLVLNPIRRFSSGISLRKEFTNINNPPFH